MSVIGFGCLVAELLNFRKYLPYLVAAALAVTLATNIVFAEQYATYYKRMIGADVPSMWFSEILVAITFCIVLLSARFYKEQIEKISDYLSIIIFTAVGALLMVYFNNFVILFLGIEILSVSLYILAASNKKNIYSTEAGLKYFLLGAFTTGFLLLGITLVYGVTGKFDVMEIRDYIFSHQVDIVFIVGAVLILIAMLFKAAIVPFHFWAPDVYTGAPLLITAYMSTLAKVAIFGAIVRFFSYGFFPIIDKIEFLLLFFVIITFVVSNITALKQDSFRRIMAYSGISHAGFLLLGIIASKPGAGNSNSVLYYVVAYAASSIIAFCAALMVEEWKGGDKVSDFNGFAKKYPIHALLFTIALLSMAGIPPLAGFWGKYYILLETISNGYIYVAVIAILASVVGLFYYFKFIYAMYVEEERIESPAIVGNAIYTFVMLLCILVIIAIGLFPNLLTDRFM